MASDFSRALALLRKERGETQHAAAAGLGVSQALLSHYEKGIREPGLAFVVRACDYYRVSADFLLGRTSSREGGVDLSGAAGPEASESAARGGARALRQSRQLSGAVGVLFSLLGRLRDRSAADAAAAYLGSGVYLLWRRLCQAAGERQFDEGVWEALADADRALCAHRYARALRQAAEERQPFPSLSPQALAGEYAVRSQNLNQVLAAAEGRLRDLAEEDGERP